MTHTAKGQSSTSSTAASLAIEEKSGYDSPAVIPYTVDRDTPASEAMAVKGRPSASNASESALATLWAATASTGASLASRPVGKSPEASQERGGGDFRRTMTATLPHESPQVGGDSPTSQSVRIIGQLGGLVMREPLEAFARSQAALDELRLVEVPVRRAVTFAASVPDPTTGQRRQAYLALEVFNEALAFEDPKTALRAVLDAHPRAKRRSDRARVQSAALYALTRLPSGVRSLSVDLGRALGDLSPDERSLVGEKDYPRALVALPDGSACIVEVHPARKPGGEDDLWMGRRIAADLIIGRHIGRFSGVLVFRFRTGGGLHVVDLQHRHAFGGCTVCRQVNA